MAETGSGLWLRGELPCDERCEVPADLEMSEVPPPRHAWDGVVRCPNNGCGRWWLIRRVEGVSGVGDE